jgi:glutaredoxin
MLSRDTWSFLIALVLVFGGWELYQRHHDRGLGVQIARMALHGDIHMISSTTCVYCRQAKTWFEANDILFDECFVDTDRACAQEFEAHGAPGTPLIRVKGRWQLGFLPERVLSALGTAAPPVQTL